MYDEIIGLTRGFYSHAHDQVFQWNLVGGLPNQWHGRAGARYLYVCGYPAQPLEEYSPEDLDHELRKPGCVPERLSLATIRPDG